MLLLLLICLWEGRRALRLSLGFHIQVSSGMPDALKFEALNNSKFEGGFFLHFLKNYSLLGSTAGWLKALSALLGNLFSLLVPRSLHTAEMHLSNHLCWLTIKTLNKTLNNNNNNNVKWLMAGIFFLAGQYKILK